MSKLVKFQLSRQLLNSFHENPQWSNKSWKNLINFPFYTLAEIRNFIRFPGELIIN